MINAVKVPPSERSSGYQAHRDELHKLHCNQGEFAGSCKYGDSDCPTMAENQDQGETEMAQSTDTLAILRMETRQATADINARLDALERDRAKSIGQDPTKFGESLIDTIANDLRAANDALRDFMSHAPEPRPYPGEWTKPGDKVQCVTTDAIESYRPGEIFRMLKNGKFKDRTGYRAHGDYGTFIPYVEPAACGSMMQSNGPGAQPVPQPPPEYPWHDHDGSDKCPVPKRRRGEMIAFDKSDPSRMADDCETWDWTVAEHWAYTQPDPKPRKWGPWVTDVTRYGNVCDAWVQWDPKTGDYIRHRVRT